MSQTDLERSNAYAESVKAAVRGELAFVWTALPGIISSFNAERQTAEVQPTTKAEITAPDGKVTLTALPLLLDCPVHFPEGGGAVLTFAVKPGDECLVVFASRCIDAWWQNGGVQPQADLRMHDLSDGFVMVGFRSLPRVIANLSTTATELRALDGVTKVALDPVAHTLTLQADPANKVVISPGAVAITAPTLTHNGINIGATHVHAGVQAGAANTAVPH